MDVLPPLFYYIRDAQDNLITCGYVDRETVPELIMVEHGYSRVVQFTPVSTALH